MRIEPAEASEIFASFAPISNATGSSQNGTYFALIPTTIKKLFHQTIQQEKVAE